MVILCREYKYYIYEFYNNVQYYYRSIIIIDLNSVNNIIYMSN